MIISKICTTETKTTCILRKEREKNRAFSCESVRRSCKCFLVSASDEKMREGCQNCKKISKNDNFIYVHLLFEDYSSAFNDIRPIKLTGKLAKLGVSTPTCYWILDFLTDRPQVVRIGKKVSAELTVSPGAPQGCYLSPKLF